MAIGDPAEIPGSLPTRLSSAIGPINSSTSVPLTHTVAKTILHWMEHVPHTEVGESLSKEWDG